MAASASASEDYWPSEESDTQPIFLVPIAHVEEIFIVRHLFSSTPKSAYQIIIVPTAATGSSSIMRPYTEIISFMWPDQKADKHLKGTMGEVANPQDTYLSILKRVLNEQLTPLRKSVTCPPASNSDDQSFICSATISFRRESDPKYSKIEGYLYFLNPGVLFISAKLRLYLPFASFIRATIVVARDHALYSGNPVRGGNGRPVSLEIHITAREPYYKEDDAATPQAKESGQLLSFTKTVVHLLGKLKAYASSHGIKFDVCQQEYYDFAKDQVMGGWDPVR